MSRLTKEVEFVRLVPQAVMRKYTFKLTYQTIIYPSFSKRLADSLWESKGLATKFRADFRF